MIGLPGTDAQIRSIITNRYGAHNSTLFWDRFYECMISEDDFIYMKKLGVNALRIPFNYKLFESDQAPYHYDMKGFKLLDRIISLCSKYKIYAILDLHAAPGGQSPDWHCDNDTGENLFWRYPEFQKRVLALWKHIAGYYKDNPAVGAYDILNEPVADGYGKECVSHFYNNAIETIRSVDSNHVLFVEGDFYGSDFSMFQPFSDPGVACSFHFYPFFDAEKYRNREDRVELIEKDMYNTRQFKFLTEVLKRPLWCGETGVPSTENFLEENEMLLCDTLKVFNKNNISWTLWTYKDSRSMGLVRPKRNSAWQVFSEKVKNGWDFHAEFSKMNNMTRSYLLNFTKEPTEKQMWRSKFHMLLCNQKVYTDFFTRAIEDYTFDYLMESLLSFKFNNCEIWSGLENAVKECVLE